ncbi:MAG: FlgD immunoglobulin-like domain containing protein [Elusimicrobiota bacterium]
MGFYCGDRPSCENRCLTNYPNPFSAGAEETVIQYYLKEDAETNLVIYDLLGNPVKRWHFAAGENAGGRKGINPVKWDGRNGQGAVVANGGYICRVEVNGGRTKIRKILVVK